MSSSGKRISLFVPGSSSSGAGSSGDGVLARVSSSISQSHIVHKGRKVAGDAAVSAKKLMRSTGKAAWIAGTTFLVLVVPLIIAMDREQQLNELDLQQTSLLGAPPSASFPPQPPSK